MTACHFVSAGFRERWHYTPRAHHCGAHAPVQRDARTGADMRRTAWRRITSSVKRDGVVVVGEKAPWREAALPLSLNFAPNNEDRIRLHTS